MKKILPILILLSGCSTWTAKPLMAPSYERINVIKDELNQVNSKLKLDGSSDSLAQEYLLAMKSSSSGNKKKACRHFGNLADNEYFPLNQAALVRSLENCSYASYDLKRIWKQTLVAKYLRESYLDISLNLAEQLKIDEYAADFSYELVAFKNLQKEKVQLLKKAIVFAKRLKDFDRENRYNQKLAEISPQYASEVTKENIYLVAKDYEASREFDIARNLYLELINSPEHSLEDKIKAYNSYRISFKVERNLKMFLEKTGEMELYLRQLLEESPDDPQLQEAWVDAKINYARAIWTEHLNEEARNILDDILNMKIGSSTQLATIHWIYGSLYLESKENIRALQSFEKAAEYKVNIRDQQENIQWSVVWNKYLLKKYSEMLVDVENYIKKSNNSNFINKLIFWKGKALVKLKRAEEAKEIFEKISTSDSFGYYGILSTIELKADFTPLPQSEIIKDPFGNIILDWLIAMDEKKLSIKYLKEINSQFKTVAERERAMSLYAQTGWYQGGMLQIYNLPMQIRDEMTSKYISVVYPIPYFELFSKYSKKYKVPEAYQFAITRQESAFNPSVRSWADAFGLMQMTPEKARELSIKYKISFENFNDLYDPSLNIEMGTALLFDLRTMFRGKFVQSTAAYNASTEVISVWEKERFNGDYVEFIEMIPYEETRNYIKLVLRNYIVYKRIMNKESFKISNKFFETQF